MLAVLYLKWLLVGYSVPPASHYVSTAWFKQPRRREQELSLYTQGFMQDALPATTLPISRLGTGTEYTSMHTLWLGLCACVLVVNVAETCIKFPQHKWKMSSVQTGPVPDQSLIFFVQAPVHVWHFCVQENSLKLPFSTKSTSNRNQHTKFKDTNGIAVPNHNNMAAIFTEFSTSD